MIRIISVLLLTSAYALSSGCLTPQPWWDKELKAWVGASGEELDAAWGPPRRTIMGDSGNPVRVYESHTVIDSREDNLRDPSQMVSSEVPGPAPRVEEFECTMYFEIVDDKVAAAWNDGAGCQVVLRRPERP